LAGLYNLADELANVAMEAHRAGPSTFATCLKYAQHAANPDRRDED
jgi:hypothetical protein